ncbi:MAG TPA: GNAT family N-acetyltransferase [Beijerinckiaceae bacterium]|nr:GNAT family N-acetyltransferase [Beijerinckiaceae bacterium]
MVRRLDASAAASLVDDLAAILAACVAGGAGVGFVLPFSEADAAGWWRSVLPMVVAGERLLFGGFVDGHLAGTVSLVPATPQNQPHRADISKMLVHPSARRRGLGVALMQAAEAEARRLGKTLLTLDTVTGSGAEQLYAGLGWQKSGVIPNYALSPTRSYDSTTVMWKAL